MGRFRGRDGLLRGAPPYPWWQWLIGGIAWAAVMFLIFNALSGFRHIALNAIIWPIAAIIATLWTRQRIVARERRAGRLPAPKR